MVFVAAIAVSALLATLDIIYDRHLSLKSGLMAVFFAFNLFVCINVMLPMILSIKNSLSLRISALLALTGFASTISVIRLPPPPNGSSPPSPPCSSWSLSDPAAL